MSEGFSCAINQTFKQSQNIYRIPMVEVEEAAVIYKII